jgi:hypothetical protein
MSSRVIARLPTTPSPLLFDRQEIARLGRYQVLWDYRHDSEQLTISHGGDAADVAMMIPHKFEMSEHRP